MENKVKCLIVDDERASHIVLKNYIENVDNLELCGHAYNVLEAINFLHGSPVDLIFLDINMPQLSGFDLLKTLTKPPAIIIITAYPEFAAKSYEFGVIDYLLKPIEFSRFLKSITRFFSSMPAKRLRQEKLNHQQQFVNVKVNSEMIDIPADEILYTKSLGNYVSVITLKKDYLCSCSTVDIEKKLPQNRFMRIHKSHIVSLEKIEKLLANSIIINNTELPVGITFRRKLAHRLGGANDHL